MKKLIAILVVFALFASTAFAADVYFGAWGRADFTPIRIVAPDVGDSVTTTATEVNWGILQGWGTPAFGFQFTLDGGEIGFTGKIKVSGTGVSGDEGAWTWWKPADIFQLTVGWARWEVLRGAGAAESFNNYAGHLGAGYGFGEENIFARFDTGANGSSIGAIIQLTPIENLYVGAAIRTGMPWYMGDDDDGEPIMKSFPYGETEDVFKYSQYAIGYNIPGIGLARAGYFGDMDQAIQAAFALKAVDGVTVDLGFTYKTAEYLEDGAGNNMVIALVADIGITDMIKVWFGATANLGKEVGDKAAGDITFGLNPTFSLDFGTIGLGAYFGLGLLEKSPINLGFDLYLSKNVGGGEFKAGVAMGMVSYDGGGSDITFSIPIEITYSIW